MKTLFLNPTILSVNEYDEDVEMSVGVLAASTSGMGAAEYAIPSPPVFKNVIVVVQWVDASNYCFILPSGSNFGIGQSYEVFAQGGNIDVYSGAAPFLDGNPFHTILAGEGAIFKLVSDVNGLQFVARR